jgi:hypothetical protein
VSVGDSIISACVHIIKLKNKNKMGSWNGTCAVSNLPIMSGEKVGYYNLVGVPKLQSSEFIVNSTDF